ncbi:18059_t:CDS:2, partial [Cetraspora pellucida]
MEHMEQEVSDLISLSDSEPESKEHLEGSEFFTRQPRKCISLSKTAERKKKRPNKNDMILNDTNEPVSNQVASSTPSENSSYDNKLSKPDLKDIQLVPINKVPGKSWIWSYYQLYKPVEPYKRIHSLTETIHKQKQKPSTQPNIGQMFQKMVATDSKRKASQNQKFVKFDPNYQLPSEKLCRKLLTDAFVSSKETLKNILNDNVITCSLTCDLWTGCNRIGYLRVMCSFIDNNFQLNELVLTIRYLPYPHTGESIAEALNVIINEWELTNKIFTITTDNESNM